MWIASDWQVVAGCTRRPPAATWQRSSMAPLRRQTWRVQLRRAAHCRHSSERRNPGAFEHGRRIPGFAMRPRNDEAWPVRTICPDPTLSSGYLLHPRSPSAIRTGIAPVRARPRLILLFLRRDQLGVFLSQRFAVLAPGMALIDEADGAPVGPQARVGGYGQLPRDAVGP